MAGALVLTAFLARAGDAPVVKASPGLKNATILVIRHSEKPEIGIELTPAGEKRAAAYPEYFKNYQLDGKPLKLEHVFAAADSKNSHRSRLTVEPLGKALGLELDMRYANKKFQDLVDELQATNHGQQMLICWHHGQIPSLVQALGADPEKLLPGGKWPDATFDWILQLRYDENGVLIPAETKVVHEKLMPGDSQ
jgi:broad specificity phosphatase PhoE